MIIFALFKELLILVDSFVRHSLRRIRYVAAGVMIFVLGASSLFAQDGVPDIIVPDTIRAKNQQQKADVFYDKLKTKTSGSRVSRTLYNAIVFSSPGSFIEYAPNGVMVNETKYFNQFKGSRIDSIIIHRNNVFDDTFSETNASKLGNRLHIKTKERVIRQNLIFKTGDEIDPVKMAINEQLLRELTYIAEAYIVIARNSKDSTGVKVYVFTRDKWTVSLDYYSVEPNNYYLSIYDNNFFGLGDRLAVRTYVSNHKPYYGGNMVEYRMLNLGGSFYNAEVFAGKGFEEYRYGAAISRDFILPTDHALGTAIQQRRFYEPQPMSDTVLLVSRFDMQYWAGKSWKKDILNGSTFLTGAYARTKYNERPEILPDSNTYYHNRHTLLMATGLYRERFYRGNMIYGFGITEDIPYGHKIQLTSGHVWDEFGNMWYGALDFSAARQTRIGYFRGTVSASSHFDPDNGYPRRGALNMGVNYFSNRFDVGLVGIRQFFNFSYTRGFRRDEGEGEALTLLGMKGPRHFIMSGNSRAVLSGETVVFSPIYFYGFRFVFYGFGNAVWLGDDNRVFRNDFFTTFGLGVRIRNERLIFNTIQLRVGFAVGRNGLLDYNNFDLSTQPRLNIPPLRPVAPEVVMFR